MATKAAAAAAPKPEKALVFTWEGSCTQNDDREFYIRIFNYYAGTPYDCAPFTLEIELPVGSPIERTEPQ